MGAQPLWAGEPEKQSIDCMLVTRDNADLFEMFRRKER